MYFKEPIGLISSVFPLFLQKMAGSMLDRHPSTFDNFNNKCILIFLERDNYKDLLISDQYAVSSHDSVFCVHDKCRFHVLLYADDMDDLFNTLRDKSFKYQHAECLYGYYKYYIANGQLILKRGHIMDKLAQAVTYNSKYPHMEVQHGVLRKKIKRKMRKSHRPILSSKSIAVQTVDSTLNARIDQVLRGKLALDFLNILDCFVDGNGCVESKNVSFYCK